MKKSLLIGLALLLAGTGVARPIVVKTGIEVLKAQRFELLEGKRVGLITNPTGVDDGLRSTVDILNEAPMSWMSYTSTSIPRSISGVGFRVLPYSE